MQRVTAESADVTVIFLVRHAEQDLPPYKDDPPDPALNIAGRERAQRLAHVLRDVGITRIMSTQYARAQSTAEPLAQALGLDIAIYSPDDLKSVANKLRTLPGRTLVVGHSNTTPDLVALLGGEPGAEIDHNDEYDRLYVVTPSAQAAQTLLLRYGRTREEDPPAQ
jgi:broad specificity phosphatase PhoE